MIFNVKESPNYERTDEIYPVIIQKKKLVERRH